MGFLSVFRRAKAEAKPKERAEPSGESGITVEVIEEYPNGRLLRRVDHNMMDFVMGPFGRMEWMPKTSVYYEEKEAIVMPLVPGPKTVQSSAEGDAQV
jgi:hypothetical protein